MKEDPDVIGIYYWKEDDGYHYRCRGIGKTYNEFYGWINQYCKSYKSTSEDWPWDFFIIRKLSEEKEMWNKFEQHMIKDED